MKLFHGSNIKISEVDLDKSKPYKDFGNGFYLSDTHDQAMEMAQFKAMQLGGSPIVSEFEFDRNGLLKSDLMIKIFNSYSEEWVDFVIGNRNGNIQFIHDFVYGPIADDKVGLQLRKYNDLDINKTQLLQNLKYFKGVTFQYFFGTEKALSFLKAVNK